MRLRDTLPMRLSWWIGSILILFFVFATGLISYAWYQSMVRTLQQHCRAAARETAYSLDRIFVRLEMGTSLLADTLEEKNYRAETIPAMLETMTREMHGQCPELSSLSIVYAEHMLDPSQRYNAFIGCIDGNSCRMIRWDDRSGVDYFTREWYMVPMTLGKAVWTTPYASDAQPGTALLSYSTPFYRRRNGRREIAGVVVADLKVATLEHYLHKLSVAGNAQLSADVTMILMNPFGQIALSSDKTGGMNRTLFSLCDAGPDSDPADRKNARMVFRTNDGHTTFNKADFGMGRCEMFYAACVNHWVVGIVIPDSWEARLLLPWVLRFLAGSGVALVLIILVIFVICHRVHRPLAALSRAAAEIGSGELHTPLPVCRRNDEIAALTGSFRRMREELADYIARLKATVAARERAEGELNAAKAIQRDILPSHLPPTPDCPDVTAAASLIPAHGVGGDLYDVFPIGKNRLALIVGDVSGKGVPAALFMAVTQTLLRGLAEESVMPGAMATRLNALIGMHNEANMFVTCWIGILDTASGKLEYANCGHNPPLLRRADGGAEYLRTRHGPPLAVLPDCVYENSELLLSDDDLLILYTDGVTEAFNAGGEMFGEARLREVAAAAADQPEALVHAIEQKVAEHAVGVEQSDDITLLIVQYHPVSESQ